MIRGISIPFIASPSSLVFTLLAIGILVFSLVIPGQVSGIRMKAADIAAPILATIVKPVTDIADVVRNVSGLAELQAENIRLQQENLRLQEWYQTALLLQAENKSLKDLLNVAIEPQYTTIAARVLSDSGSAFAKSLLVSAGASDGVEKGQAVLASQGLIGRVIEVGENTARVLLMTDINSRIPVLIEETRQHAILAGKEQGKTALMHVPPDVVLNKDARIVTSGHGGIFPPGLAIGRLSEAGSGKGYREAAINVTPFADFHRLVHVRIVDHQPNNIIAP